MPVGVNQWKARDAAAKTAAAGPPPAETQPSAAAQDASSSAARKGRLQNFRTKSTEGKDAQSAKDAAAAEAAAAAAAAEQQNQQSKSKSVAGKWQAPQDDQKVVRKKRLEVTEGGDDSRRIMVDPANVGIIIENEPVRLEGVVRSDDPSEFQKPLELEKGWAKNMASRFQNIGSSEDPSESRKSFKMDVEIGAEPEVHENEPVRLEGVVRASDRTEDVIGKRGNIKNIAGRFASGAMSASDGNNNGDAAPPPASGPSRRSVLARFERGPIDSDGSVVLAENVPAELDPNVVRASADGYRANDPVMEAGKIRNMAGRFLMQKTSVDEDDDEDSRPKSSKPAWLIELEKAKEAETRIIENEPEVRDDVVRADDDIPDIISVQHTRSLRHMWNQIEKDKEAAEKQPKNRPLPPIAKPKEPSPEPEPPKPPPEEPKPKYGPGRRQVGKLQLGQLQKEEPAKPAATGKVGTASAGTAVAGGSRQQVGPGGKLAASAAGAPAPAPAAEVDTKGSTRPFSKPSLKPIQASKK